MLIHTQRDPCVIYLRIVRAWHIVSRLNIQGRMKLGCRQLD
uniref:Uncharacterized protein n=1 Tax=Anguilla anguilla TaxID=7936 RepID=A0A0E9R201_ANGAN